MDEIIIQMLTHMNPLAEPDLSIEQLEAVRAVLLTIANTDQPAALHGALLAQDTHTMRVLDGLCVQFVQRLVREHDSRSNGIQLQARGSSVGNSIRQIELQLKAANGPGVGSRLQRKAWSGVGSLQANQKSVLESMVPGSGMQPKTSSESESASTPTAAEQSTRTPDVPEQSEFSG